mmetsp:Transcript_29279/g.82602  ORF Transcript_29279/g.82602 Transcript_29279/m.82602 type:complete len:603 (-) Transcript_29279:338-2146(-)|eukprot:CAMPEP_0117653272 /NCGR_PEP_ID=MMETSP0804-20121206/3098_1 /TAXON_ID=1074897 /ORGANISM="Tetraselmis astigmatica, Strain CCMP880" /LENGTH=602 /DNA_ID=CAMNT_0005459427 /DNA_START=57 /DNA_END=1865 /DNA_ORIENTATION=-
MSGKDAGIGDQLADPGGNSGDVKGSLEIAAGNGGQGPVSREPRGKLAFHVGPVTRWGMLALLVASSACYLTGQIADLWGLGASVQMTFSSDSGLQPVVYNYPPYTMSLMFSIEACFKYGSGAEYLLGTVLFLFSGVWPHVKLLLMLACWFVPLPHRRRQIILYWADSFGKFSFADPLVVVMLMVAFNTGVTLTQDSFLWTPLVAFLATKNPEIDPADVESVTFTIEILSAIGIYFFCAGVWLSLLLGSIMEHFNTHLISSLPAAAEGGKDGTTFASQMQTQEKLQAHPFRQKTRWVVATIVLPVIALMIASICVPLLVRHIDGVLSYLVVSLEWADVPKGTVPAEPMSFSFILRAVALAGTFGDVFLAVTVTFFVLAVPLLRGPALVAEWLGPFRRPLHESVHTAFNMIAICDALPVFLFAVVLVVFEITSITKEIDFPFCDDVATVMGLVAAACDSVPAPSPAVQSSVQRLLETTPTLNAVVDAIATKCPDFSSNLVAFDMSDCLLISLESAAGIWLVLTVILLCYAGTMLLGYPSSIELLGRRFFELPVCWRREGWCCCLCCSGSLYSEDEEDDSDGLTGGTGESKSDLPLALPLANAQI